MSTPTIIPVDAEKWAYMLKCTAALEFLGRRGLCWRNADKLEPGWIIPTETEWLYSSATSSLEDKILKHREHEARNQS